MTPQEVFEQDCQTFGKPVWYKTELGGWVFGFPQYWVSWSIEFWWYEGINLPYITRRAGGVVERQWLTTSYRLWLFNRHKAEALLGW